MRDVLVKIENQNTNPTDLGRFSDKKGVFRRIKKCYGL
jgi:hypothetical protein